KLRHRTVPRLPLLGSDGAGAAAASRRARIVRTAAPRIAATGGSATAVPPAAGQQSDAAAPPAGAGDAQTATPPVPFDEGGIVTVLEDAPPFTQPWAALPADAPPPAFTTSASRPDLFSRPPVVAADGTLSFTPARDAFGASRVDVVDSVSGKSAFFTIDVLPVNDPPAFTAGPGVSAFENEGVQTAAWASGISPGPANETGQQVSFTTATDNPALFLPGGLPTVDSRGVLAFTPAMFATGQATVTVTARDDGGTANGGRDATTA